MATPPKIFETLNCDILDVIALKLNKKDAKQGKYKSGFVIFRNVR